MHKLFQHSTNKNHVGPKQQHPKAHCTPKWGCLSLSPIRRLNITRVAVRVSVVRRYSWPTRAKSGRAAEEEQEQAGWAAVPMDLRPQLQDNESATAA